MKIRNFQDSKWHAIKIAHGDEIFRNFEKQMKLKKNVFLDSSSGSPTLSDSSSLEDAKNECLENPECTGITKDASSVG